MLNATRGYSLIVLGDAMLDIYVRGKVERISPEAPVPVLRFAQSAEVVGGAANVATNVTRLGTGARLIGVIGADREGERLTELVHASKVEFLPIVEPSRPTTTKTRVMDDRHHLLRIDREEVAPIEGATEDMVLERVAAALPEAGALVISDYAKGVLTARVLAGAIGLARSAGLPVLVDPKRRDFSVYAGATLIKANRSELAAASGLPCEEDEDVRRAAEASRRVTGAALLVTRSEKGMSYFADDAPPIHMPTEAKLVFDVSGAGDAVLATIACGLVNSVPIEQAMRLANLAAGIVVSKPGTATLSLDELRAAALDQRTASVFRKGALVTAAEAAAVREHWRREGFTVGFTNGCFDLVHPGHIASLRGAASQCDRLIVALNTDASIKRLKGPGRPIQSEESRAAVIGAMSCVDLVVLFDEETPVDLIRTLMPDVLAKGADYAEEDIVGADIVRAAGGRVVRIPLVNGHSTTVLLARGATSRQG
jgi:D-beta-D-heptose 7-phosphate kinase / D-beta-D-heptose 1-phosphate adenosyltransferase